MSDLISIDRALEQIPNGKSCDNTVVASMISAASGVIENYCRRKFALADYKELHTVAGLTQFLFINNPPIVKVNDVRSGQLPALYIQCADPLNQTQRATVEVTDTGVTLVRTYSNVTTTNTFAFATYQTFTDLANAINALGFPWTATVSPQFALWQTGDMVQQGTWNTANTSVPLLVYQGRPFFKVNKDIGELYNPGRWTIGYQSVYVNYTGGYDVIPEEIQYVCAVLVSQMYAARNVNPALTSETLDKYSYTKAATQGFDNLPDSVRLTLNQYKILNVARYK